VVPDEKISGMATKKLSLRPALFIAAVEVSFCIAAFLCRIAYLYLPSLWSDPHTINFLAAWIPAVLSVLVAFIPDKELEVKRRIAWRAGVIVCGVFYSVVLWHQQSLTDQSNGAANAKLIGDAVAQANQHSDEKFKSVTDQVQKVGEQVGTKTKELGDAFDRAAGEIKGGLGKIGKPELPGNAEFQFSLWRDGILDEDWPIESTLATPELDGSYKVQFVMRNTSSIEAKNVDFWINICSYCAFAKEPEGFDRPSGMDEHLRHRMFQSINPGVGSPMSTIYVKPLHPELGFFDVSFAASCAACAKLNKSKDFVIKLNSLAK